MPHPIMRAAACALLLVSTLACVHRDDSTFAAAYADFAALTRSHAPAFAGRQRIQQITCESGTAPLITAETGALEIRCASARPMIRIRFDENGIVAVALFTAHGAQLATREDAP